MPSHRSAGPRRRWSPQCARPPGCTCATEEASFGFREGSWVRQASSQLIDRVAWASASVEHLGAARALRASCCAKRRGLRGLRFLLSRVKRPPKKPVPTPSASHPIEGQPPPPLSNGQNRAHRSPTTSCAADSARPIICAVRTRGHISLRDIQNMPTRSKFVFFQGFLNFLSKAPKFHSVGGGMCMLFEICEKRPFQKCMGWGGIGDHIFEYRGRPFRRFRVFRPQAAPLMRAGHQLTGLPLGAPTYCGVGAKWKEVNGCILTC